MRRFVLLFWLVLGAIILISAPAAARGDRVALIFGMKEYQTVPPLDNTVNDARAMAGTLQSIGFDVTTVIDAGAREMRSAIEDFSFRAETADLALIYFAGHGVEVEGENFLIPVDADVRTNRDIQRVSVSLKELLASVDAARRMRIVILDSCRDNPFTGTLDRTALEASLRTAGGGTRSAAGTGLAPPTPDRGTLVSFAAKDGEKALDGEGGNSPFAAALIKILPEPGLEISLAFRKVRDEVLRQTANYQEPHTYGSLSGVPFYLAGTPPGSAVMAENPRVAWSDLGNEQEARLASLAAQGDTRSMVGLAYMRLNSEDRRYDPEGAAGYLSDAAEAGAPEAQFELGKLHEIGLGVPQDVARALALYEMAAAQGHGDALNDLGFLYFQGGMGITADPARALEYFRRAAEARQPQAMFNYAALIDDGAVPGQGPDAAAEFLYRALRSGSRTVFEALSDRPTMFKPDTRRALQALLGEHAFYGGPLDGDLGPGSQEGIRRAFGLRP